MKKVLISITFLICCFMFMGGVNALTIPAPKITGVESSNATSLKVKYNTNNTNSNYKVLVYNMTNGKLIKQAINTTEYTFAGLETGKVYNVKVRIYYLNGTKPYTSDWSNIVSTAPKAGNVTINSLNASNNQGILSYSTTGNPSGVEIYVKELGKSFKTTNLTSYTVPGLTNGKTYTTTARTYYSNGAYGNWSSVKALKFTIPPASSSSPAPATASSTASVNLGSLVPSSKTLVINYGVSEKPTGVEIYVKEQKKSYKTTNLKTYKLSGLTNGQKYTITARTYYSNGKYGSWSATKAVTLPTWSSIIDSTAKKLAWPMVNGKKNPNRKYKGGKRTPAYTEALYKYFPSYKGGKHRYQKGASCSVFVATVVRASGYDSKFPSTKYGPYLKNSSKWKNISNKNARAGDIFFFKTGSSSGNHILIYGGTEKGHHVWYQANADKEYGYKFYGKNPLTDSYKKKHRGLIIGRAK